MTDLLLIGFLNACWIVGVWAAALPGQILDPIATLLAGDSKAVPPIEGIFPEWATKPLFLCPICMPSLHGSVWYLVAQPGPLWLLPVYVVCLAGVMKVVTILVLSLDNS